MIRITPVLEWGENGALYPEGPLSKTGQTVVKMKLKSSQSADVSALYPHFNLSLTLAAVYPVFALCMTPIRSRFALSRAVYTLSPLYPQLWVITNVWMWWLRPFDRMEDEVALRPSKLAHCPTPHAPSPFCWSSDGDSEWQLVYC